MGWGVVGVGSHLITRKWISAPTSVSHAATGIVKAARDWSNQGHVTLHLLPPPLATPRPPPTGQPAPSIRSHRYFPFFCLPVPISSAFSIRIQLIIHGMDPARWNGIRS